MFRTSGTTGKTRTNTRVNSRYNSKTEGADLRFFHTYNKPPQNIFAVVYCFITQYNTDRCLYTDHLLGGSRQELCQAEQIPDVHKDALRGYCFQQLR